VMKGGKVFRSWQSHPTSLSSLRSMLNKWGGDSIPRRGNVISWSNIRIQKPILRV
jgi:hypothetical protein